jgi:hypothetical protein
MIVSSSTITSSVRSDQRSCTSPARSISRTSALVVTAMRAAAGQPAGAPSIGRTPPLARSSSA